MAKKLNKKELELLNLSFEELISLKKKQRRSATVAIPIILMSLVVGCYLLWYAFSNNLYSLGEPDAYLYILLCLIGLIVSGIVLIVVELARVSKTSSIIRNKRLAMDTSGLPKTVIREEDRHLLELSDEELKSIRIINRLKAYFQLLILISFFIAMTVLFEWLNNIGYIKQEDINQWMVIYVVSYSVFFLIPAIVAGRSFNRLSVYKYVAKEKKLAILRNTYGMNRVKRLQTYGKRYIKDPVSNRRDFKRVFTWFSNEILYMANSVYDSNTFRALNLKDIVSVKILDNRLKQTIHSAYFTGNALVDIIGNATNKPVVNEYGNKITVFELTSGEEIYLQMEVLDLLNAYINSRNQ